MKIIHYVCPRGCGKTTKAKEMQMEDPENILLFTGLWTFGKSFRGLRFKKIIFDEYLGKFDESEQKRFINWLYNDLSQILTEDGEIIFISTPHKYYTKEQLVLASQIDYPFDLKENTLFDIKEIKKNIQEINYNFLNPNKVNIIKTDFNAPFAKTKEHKKELKMSLGEIYYKLQIEGEFIL